MVKHLLANFSVDTVQVLESIGVAFAVAVAVAVAVVNTLGINMVAKVVLVY